MIRMYFLQLVDTDVDLQGTYLRLLLLIYFAMLWVCQLLGMSSGLLTGQVL